MKSGVKGKYRWLEFNESHLNFVEEIIKSQAGAILYITSFDSGPIFPSEKEKNEGWFSQDQIMVSPKLKIGIEIPYDNYDEWYFFDKLIEFPSEQEVFVNYFGFSLVPVDEQLKDFDPTWEHDALDWLRPIQKRFWNQIVTLEPLTYVAM